MRGAHPAARIALDRDIALGLQLAECAYTRGVHDRVDAFVYYGNLTIFGRTQHYGGLGSSIGILRRARHWVDLAFLNFFSTPFNRRDEAATVSGYFALSVSRPLRIGRYSPTIYSGYLRGESFGQRADKLFSAPSGTHNGMIGVVVPLSKSLLISDRLKDFHFVARPNANGIELRLRLKQETDFEKSRLPA